MASGAYAVDPGRESFVRSPDGLDLSVREWGNPSGPEILLIHGAAQCHLSFVRQTASRLADRHRLVAFDLRGHGNSQKPREPAFYQSGKAWADDVQAVIEAKGLRRPVLVGWSLGGRVVREYLVHHGDSRIAGINFLSCRPLEHAGVVGPGSQAIATSGELDFPARLQAEIAFLLDCYAVPPDEQDLRLAIAYNMLFPRPVRDAIMAWRSDGEAARAALERVSVPVLITHGRRDRLILPRAAEMTASAIAHAELSWFDECGHAPFYEDSERYNRELETFIADRV